MIDIKELADTPPWEWPKDARKTIRNVVTNRAAAPSDRLIAAQLAGDMVVMNDDLAKTLLAIMRSPEESEALRAKAAISLGPVLEMVTWTEFGDDIDPPPITEDTYQKIQNTLKALYYEAGTPKLLRRRILEAAVRDHTQDWHAPAIREALAGGDREWVLTAVFAMGHVKGFDREIVAALDSRDENTRYEAVKAAGNWEVQAAWPHIKALVENPGTDKTLLLAAIEAVGEINPSEAEAVLADLTDSEDADVVEAVDEAISMVRARSSDEHEDEDWDEDEEDDEDEDWVN